MQMLVKVANFVKKDNSRIKKSKRNVSCVAKGNMREILATASVTSANQDLFHRPKETANVKNVMGVSILRFLAVSRALLVLLVKEQVKNRIQNVVSKNI
jgi:hypothetical protein